jgi:hypothetical protein
MCVCVSVCMFQHNSRTPGVISTNLGTHMAKCMYKNLMYILYIDISPKHQSSRGGGEMMWEASVESFHTLPIATEVALTQNGIQATAR